MRRCGTQVQEEQHAGVCSVLSMLLSAWCQVMLDRCVPPDLDIRSPAMDLARRTGALRGMRVRPATWACHHADLNAREEFLGIGAEMHVPRPT
jgi:hypothetical protein